jgi:segregation and condensation protein B
MAGAQTPAAGAADSRPEANHDLARLEAILFLAREPLTSRKLSQYANLADGTQARTLVRRLNEQYDAVGRAFRVEHVAGGYQLLTRRKLAPWLRRLAHVPGETRLSAPALETLAVIAYRQPAGRADIEAIRGVNCGEILRQLMDRDLVRISGRSEELGRPYLYATTKRFLELFGLNQIDELPRGEELRTSPLPAAPPVFPVAHDQPEHEAEPSAEFDDGPIDETHSESTLG